jgi:hypothetical protein
MTLEELEKTLEEQEKLEIIKFIHDRNFRLIELADNKATSILTVNGIMLTVVFALASFIPGFFDLVTLKDYIKISFFSAYLLCSGASLFFSIRTISPIRDTGIPPPKNIFYYRQILRYKDVNEYINDVEEQLDNFSSVLRSLVNQIYSISSVNQRKYKNVLRCVWLLLFSFLIFILLIISLFI